MHSPESCVRSSAAIEDLARCPPAQFAASLRCVPGDGSSESFALQKAFPDGFACHVVLLRLKAAARYVSPALIARRVDDPADFSTENRCAVLRDGIRLVQDVGRQSCITPCTDRGLAPGRKRHAIRSTPIFARQGSPFIFHLDPVVRGQDSESTMVVDPELCFAPTISARSSPICPPRRSRFSWL